MSAGSPRRPRPKDVVSGLAGIGVMIGALITPFRRGARSASGAGCAGAGDGFPGDDLVPEPTWQWTHAIGIQVPAAAVWPWVAQIGADRAGFYSYEWLENLVGCRLHNADAIHPEWAHRAGGQLSLHPKVPPLRIVSVEDGRSLVAYLPRTSAQSRWMTASWLFLVQPAGAGSCRLISRYRCATSADLASRLQFGPALVEPIGFAMDRRMLIGIKQRAEDAAARS